MAAAATKIKEAVPSLSEKFDIEMRSQMRSRLVERDDEIEIFLLALAARTHAFFHGEPGIAKSLLVEIGMSLIGELEPGDYFHTLMMKSTTREDIFGPLMLSLLKQDRYKYNPKGYLPEAKFFFGDEFWKANAAILNALLWAMNERLYRNDGEVLKIPLWSAFIASNEMPEGDELNAIYDRFPLRKTVQAIREPGNFISMLKLSNAPIDPVITWDEIEQAHKEVQAVVIPNDVLEALSDLKEKLKEQSIFPSDRRFRVALDIVKAKAWLDGETEADIEHLRPLRHVLWTDPEHYIKVDQLISGMANPIDLEIMDIMKDLSGLSTELEKIIADPGDALVQKQLGTQLFDKIEKAMNELTDKSDRLAGSRRKSAKLEPAKELVISLSNRLLVKVFNMSPDEIDANNLTAFANMDTDDGDN